MASRKEVGRGTGMGVEEGIRLSSACSCRAAARERPLSRLRAVNSMVLEVRGVVISSLRARRRVGVASAEGVFWRGVLGTSESSDETVEPIADLGAGSLLTH